MKRAIVLLALVAALTTWVGVPRAGAVDGFTQPRYSGTPIVHQTEACDGISPGQQTCYRVVRQGGRFMQENYAQVVHESALLYEICSYGWTEVDPYTHVRWWHWRLIQENPVGSFCFVLNSVTHDWWSLYQAPY